MAKSLVQIVLLGAIAQSGPIQSLVLLVIFVQLVLSFPSHVILVHTTLLPARHLVQIVLQGTTVHLQLDGIPLLTIDLNAPGDIFAKPELLHLPNVLLVVTMTNLEIQTPLALLVMLVNTAQLEHQIVDMSVLLVIGVLVELAMPTLQVMHVQLVLTQKEKEGHPTSTVTIAQKGIIAPQQVQLHRCLVRPEHINRPQEEQHVTNVMLEWLVRLLDYLNQTIFAIMVITAQLVQIIQTVGEPFPTGHFQLQGILLLRALLESISSLPMNHKMENVLIAH